MLSAIALICTLATVLLTGAMTGVFFAFSVAVMPGLSADARVAVAAMRSINRRIQNPLFFVAFFGAPFTALAAGVVLMLVDRVWPAGLMFASGAAYLLGALLPTLIVNVPLNISLDRRQTPEHVRDAADIWSGYAGRWTRWNSVRGICSAVALLLAAAALARWAG